MERHTGRYRKKKALWIMLGVVAVLTAAAAGIFWWLDKMTGHAVPI